MASTRTKKRRMEDGREGRQRERERERVLGGWKLKDGPWETERERVRWEVRDRRTDH